MLAPIYPEWWIPGARHIDLCASPYVFDSSKLVKRERFRDIGASSSMHTNLEEALSVT